MLEFVKKKREKEKHKMNHYVNYLDCFAFYICIFSVPEDDRSAGRNVA